MTKTTRTAALTSRQRVQRAIEGRDHDRVPRHDTYWYETIERWTSEGLVGKEAGIVHELRSDFAGLDGWSDPFPDHREVIAEDDQTITLVNSWLETVKQWKDRSGTPEHLGWGCTDRNAWAKIFRPALVKAAHDNVDVASIRKRSVAARAAHRWQFLATLDPFEALRHLLGDVECMIHMIEDPEWIMEISRTWTDFCLARLEKQTSVVDELDGVWCYGDMAFNHATMCSPAMYRELIWPDHKRFATWAHERGAKFIFHTDGNVNGVLDHYQDAGFDVLQPLECKAGMDIRTLVPEHGDRLAFMGNIDVMVLATNNRERIEAEVKAKLAAGMAGRYIYHSDHSIPPQVSLDTYRFVIELLERYGNYA